MTRYIIIIISGAAAFFLLLLIIALIFLVVFTFVIKQRRKSASVNFIDPIDSEMSVQPQMLHNTRSESSETKNEQGAGKKEYIEKQCYFTDTLPTDPNVAYGTVDCMEVDANQAYGTNTIPTNTNIMAYGTNTNTVPTDPYYVAYGTHPPQKNDYEYVGLP